MQHVLSVVGVPAWCRRGISAALVSLLLVTLLPASAAHAASPVVDQSFTTPTNAAADVQFCCGEIAQTFTAGMTGALTHVSVEVSSNVQATLHVSIHGVTNGLPDERLLGQAYLWENYYTPISSAPITLLIDIGAAYVVAGQQYAIVVDYDNSGPYGETAGTWAGATGDLYDGGAAFISPDNNFASWTPAGPNGLDLHFRTFIDSTVPVFDLTIQRVSGALRAKACQVFSETYKVRNLGPDTAHNVTVTGGGADQFDPANSTGTWEIAPFDLGPGESKTVTLYWKVTGFVVGESRAGSISASVRSETWPDANIDLQPGNNLVQTTMRLISRPVMVCP